MNQIELNRIANHYINKESFELSKKLEKILYEDLAAKKEDISGPVLHHIHNTSLFFLLLNINCFYVKQSGSQAATRQYLELAESLKPKFMEIIEALKDFRPVGLESDDNHNSQEDRNE